MDEQRELMLQEIYNSNNKVIEMIKSYDDKIHKFYTNTIATTGIFFAIIGFIMNLYSSVGIKIEDFYWLFTVILVGAFLFSLYFLLLTLRKCLLGIKTRDISISDTKEFIDECQTYNIKKLQDFLIVQVSDYYGDNIETYNNLKKTYNEIIKNLRRTINSIIIFVVFSLIFLYIGGI